VSTKYTFFDPLFANKLLLLSIYRPLSHHIRQSSGFFLSSIRDKVAYSLQQLLRSTDILPSGLKAEDVRHLKIQRATGILKTT
jgi:hypothetical protein